VYWPDVQCDLCVLWSAVDRTVFVDAISANADASSILIVRCRPALPLSTIVISWRRLPTTAGIDHRRRISCRALLIVVHHGMSSASSAVLRFETARRAMSSR